MDILKLDGMLAGGKTIYDIPLRVVFYARVSTEKDGQINSLENQVSYFEDLIKNQPLWEYAGKYIDEGISGSSVCGREGFLKMIDDGLHGDFDLILTKEISRFSRNTLDSIGYTRKLRRSGVGVFFLSDNINTFDKDAELRLTIMSSIAQEEVRKLSERVRFGFGRAVKDGVCLGTHITGYTKEKGNLTVDENGAYAVKYIFEEYAKGKKGLKTIARELEEMGVLSSQGIRLSYSTLHGIIKNPKYKGVFCGGKYKTTDYRDGKKMRVPEDQWTVFKSDTVPAIVSPEVWNRANQVLTLRGSKVKARTSGFQNRYEFSGKILCGVHGTGYHRQVYKSASGEKEVWNCSQYRLKGRKDGCSSPTVYSEEIRVIVEDALKICETNKMKIADRFKNCKTHNTDGDIKKFSKELNKLRLQKEKLFELNAENIISNSEFGDRNSKLNLLISENEKALSALQKERTAVRQVLADKPIFVKAVVGGENETDSAFGENECAEIGIYVDIFGAPITVSSAENSTELQSWERKQDTPARIKFNFISLREIGISQAQVSRLEKEAINKVKGNSQ